MSKLTYSIFADHNFVDCTLFQFGWEQCDPSLSFGPDSRNHYLFQEYPLHAGQGFLICPNQINHYIADDRTPWEYTWVEFDGLKAPEFVALAVLSYDDPIYSGNVPAMQQLLKDEKLYIANHGTESSVNQKEITIEDIAAFCNLNRSYFGKIFKDMISTSPQDFLIRYRMTKACELLETINYSIGAISTQVGYPSQLHFSRTFKKIYGKSPRQWKYENLKK